MTDEPVSDWESTKQIYAVATVTEGVVVRREVFGVFVRLPNGAVGQIEAPELSPDKTLRPDEFPEVGDRIAVKVLGHRDGNRQVILGVHEP